MSWQSIKYVQLKEKMQFWRRIAIWQQFNILEMKYIRKVQQYITVEQYIIEVKYLQGQSDIELEGTKKKQTTKIFQIKTYSELKKLIENEEDEIK